MVNSVTSIAHKCMFSVESDLQLKENVGLKQGLERRLMSSLEKHYNKNSLSSLTQINHYVREITYGSTGIGEPKIVYETNLERLAASTFF